MNRQDRDRYDYGRYEGYNNDEHYHAARNLTDEFEQHYRSERGNDEGERYHPQRSYHEGSEIEESYNRQRRAHESARNRAEQMRDERDDYGHYGRYQDDYRGDSGMNRRDQYSNQDYRDRNMSSGLADDFGYDDRSNFSGSRDLDQNYRSWNEYRSAHGSDRDYSQGSGDTRRYRPEEHNRYNRESRPNRSDRWYDSNERTRYY